MRRLARIAKWAIIVAASVVVLVAAGGAAFIAFAGDDMLRRPAEVALERAVGRPVHLEGRFSLDVGLEPTLAVTEAWLENASWAHDPEMVRIQSAKVTLSLPDLLSGIVRVPRLAVAGLTVNLQTASDGQKNWVSTEPQQDASAAPPEARIFLPIFESLVVSDAVLNYRDDLSGGPDTQVTLSALGLTYASNQDRISLDGTGAVNGKPFTLAGQFGSLEDVLAATEPFPFEISIAKTGAGVTLTGTAENFGRGEGFDLTARAHADSLRATALILGLDGEIDGQLNASATLSGDAGSLTADDLLIEIEDSANRILRIDGEIADLWNGDGLDLGFEAMLDGKTLRHLSAPPRTVSDVITDAATLEVSGRLTESLSMPHFKGVDVRLTLEQQATFSLMGSAALARSEDGTSLTALGMSIASEIADPSLLSPAIAAAYGKAGPIRAEAELALDKDAIMLRRLVAEAGGPGELEVKAEGQLARLPETGYEPVVEPSLRIQTAFDTTGTVIPLLIASMLEDAQQPAVNKSWFSESDNIVLSIQRGLLLSNLDPGPLDGLMGRRTRAAIRSYQSAHGLEPDGEATLELLQHLDRTVAEAPRPPVPERTSVPDLPPILTDFLAQAGRIEASALLSGEGDGAGDEYRLDEVSVTVGEKNAFWIEAFGAVGPFRMAAEPGVDDLALSVRFAAPSSAAFPHLIPPSWHTFTNIRGRFDVGGTPEAIVIRNSEINAAGQNDLQWSATGRSIEVAALPSFDLRNLIVDLGVRAPTTAAFLALFNVDLLEFGVVRARGTLRGRGDRFSLTNIEVDAGPLNGATAKTTGSVHDLVDLKGITLRGDFQLPTATLVQLDDDKAKAALGMVHGDYELSDASGAFGIDSLQFAIRDTDYLTLSATGLIDDIAENDGIRFVTALNVPSVSRLGEELGFRADGIERFTFSGRASGDNNRLNADGAFTIGNSRIDGNLTGNFAGQRPLIRATLRSPSFTLADIGIVPQPPAASEPGLPTAKLGTPATDRIFDEEPFNFDALQAFDLELRLNFDDVKGTNFEIDTIEADVKIADSVLTIEPLLFNYFGGRLETRFHLDAQTDPPHMKLDVNADDVNLGDVWGQFKAKVPIDGEMDAVLRLTATGGSPRSLAESLDGDANVAISNGHLQTSLLDLTVINPVRWMFSRSARRGYSELNCFAARFGIEDGLATTRAMVLDTPNVQTAGNGHVDLNRERVDIDFNPRPRQQRLISISTPFKLTGPLARPAVRVSSRGAATRAIGNTVVSPINLLGSLLPFVRDRGGDSDNPCLTLEAPGD